MKLLLQNQIASHPSIYVLDTPGVFPAEILDAEVCSNLALTGTISKTLSAANILDFHQNIVTNCNSLTAPAPLVN